MPSSESALYNTGLVRRSARSNPSAGRQELDRRFSGHKERDTIGTYRLVRPNIEKHFLYLPMKKDLCGSNNQATVYNWCRSNQKFRILCVIVKWREGVAGTFHGYSRDICRKVGCVDEWLHSPNHRLLAHPGKEKLPLLRAACCRLGCGEEVGKSDDPQPPWSYIVDSPASTFKKVASTILCILPPLFSPVSTNSK